MKKTLTILALVGLTVAAIAQYIPSLSAPSISDNETYRVIRAQGAAQGIPVTVATATKVRITNYVVKVGPQTDLQFTSLINATTNGTVSLLLDTSVDNINFTVNHPLSVALTISTNFGGTQQTQPMTAAGRLLATNFTSVRYVRITWLTNATATDHIPSNIVTAYFARSP